MELAPTSLALLPFEPAPRGPVPQSIEFERGHLRTATPRRAHQIANVPRVSFGALFFFILQPYPFCKACRIRATSQRENRFAIARFRRTFYSADRRCSSAIKDSAANLSAQHSNGRVQSPSRWSCLTGQTL